MKLAVVGSRGYSKMLYIMEVAFCLDPKRDTIISGGADGPDKMIAGFARALKIPVVEHLPDWETYGRAAGPIRNKLIVDDCDELIAFWDGISKGTYSSICLAIESNKLKAIYGPNGRVFYNE